MYKIHKKCKKVVDEVPVFSSSDPVCHLWFCRLAARNDNLHLALSCGVTTRHLFVVRKVL